ncbi:class A sortase [Lysinibacillus sp. 1P01SD]|uniref:class A sortase n=1 Tax=Lysinibacillus sp. 1P01SD TaxID=3132285 RepID=UPI0039A3A151
MSSIFKRFFKNDEDDEWDNEHESPYVNQNHYQTNTYEAEGSNQHYDQKNQTSEHESKEADFPNQENTYQEKIEQFSTNENEAQDKYDEDEEDHRLTFRKKLVFVLLGVVFLIGIIAVAYQPIINYIVAPSQLEKQRLDAFALSSDEMKANLIKAQEDGTEESFNFEEVQLLDTLTVSTTINKKNVIGGIYIPSVDVNMPILYGTNQKNLQNSATTMKPDQVMGEGNYALAGHNSRNPKALFTPIRNLQKGDAIYITDKDKLYKYSVVARKVVQPTEVSVIEDIEGLQIITLVSCYSLDGKDRIIVQGELESVIDYVDAKKDILKAFNDL